MGVAAPRQDCSSTDSFYPKVFTQKECFNIIKWQKPFEHVRKNNGYQGSTCVTKCECLDNRSDF